MVDMNYDITIIVLTSMCGIGTILGALCGAILAVQLMGRNGRRMHYITLTSIRFREFIPELQKYRDDRWNVDAVVASEVLKGTVDIQLSKFF